MSNAANIAALERMAECVNTGNLDALDEGIAATGERISARGVEIVKFRDAKVIERWGSSDEMGIMTQLGMTVEP